LDLKVTKPTFREIQHMISKLVVLKQEAFPIEGVFLKDKE